MSLRPSLPQHWHRWVIVVILFAGFVAAAAATALRWTHADALRTRAVAALSERFDAQVEITRLDVVAFPRLLARGEGLTVHHKGRHDLPPLISIERFEVRADLLGLWRNRLALVKLDGLVVAIPPRAPDEPPPATEPDDRPRDGDASNGRARDILIEELIAENASFVVVPRDAGREPKTWAIHRLRMRAVAANRAFPFEATLTNAVPPGAIEVEGEFGPWQREEPGQTPLQGRFTFTDADLGYFRGISGTLSAQGVYGGTLDRIEVRGETYTPDFAIDVAGHPVPLRATYRALVDGTNGDTHLEAVDATLIETRLLAHGAIVDLEGPRGRQVELDVVIEGGRLEDVLQLAVPTPRPPMSGRLDLETRLVLPPDDAPVADRLRLDGVFALEQARFTDAGVQRKINDLSVTAQGRRSDDTPAPRVGSDFSGRFSLRDGMLQLETLTFDVPGAMVELDGHYGLRSESLDFAGALYMDARISQTTGGIKSLLLRLADPLFRREGRTVVPLKVSGTRSEPEFGLDIKRVLTRD